MCYCLDLRSDSKLAKFLSHKIVAALIAIIQLVIWFGSIFALIAPSESIKAQLNDSPAGAVAFAVILMLAGIGFSVLLLIGILKNNRTFIQVFLVFNMVVIVLFVVGILYNIFTHPARFGVSGFLSSVLHILLDVLTYFIIRNYYLGLTSKTTDPVQNPEPKGLRV